MEDVLVTFKCIENVVGDRKMSISSSSSSHKDVIRYILSKVVKDIQLIDFHTEDKDTSLFH